MKQPSSTEAHIAELNRDRVHPDVAIHTHICIMSMVRDWLEEVPPSVNWQDRPASALRDILEGILDMYEDKL